MKFASTLICLLLVAGCATTGTISTIETRIETRAGRLAVVGGKILQRVGPILTAGTCVAYPEYCTAAKAAYKAANATVVSIQATGEADDGLKLATLGEEFVKNIDVVNGVLAATGQEKIDLAEFQATMKEVSTTK
jgi:hypothetical protein